MPEIEPEVVDMEDRKPDQVSLTFMEAYVVAELIEQMLYSAIREDKDLEDIRWIVTLVSAYNKLCAACGKQAVREGEQ